MPQILNFLFMFSPEVAYDGSTRPSGRIRSVSAVYQNPGAMAVMWDDRESQEECPFRLRRLEWMPNRRSASYAS